MGTCFAEEFLLNDRFGYLRSGAYIMEQLSTGQTLVQPHNVDVPIHLQEVLRRKRKYANSISTTSLTISNSSSGTHDVLMSKPEGDVFLDFNAASVLKFVRVKFQGGADRYLRQRHDLSRVYSLSRLLDLDLNGVNNEFRLVESMVHGDWFGDLSVELRISIARTVLERSLAASVFREGGDLAPFVKWLPRLTNEIQPMSPRHKEVGIYLEQALSHTKFMRSLDLAVVQNRDLCAHNIAVRDEAMVVIDTSPSKVGLAPAWYDFLVLVTSEAAEYERSDLLDAFMYGSFDDHLTDFIDPSQPNQKMWLLSMTTALMVYLPFKIGVQRISSWLEPAFSYWARD